MRLCVLNHSSGEGDVRYALERVASADMLDGTGLPRLDAGADRAARQAALTAHWLALREVTPDDLRNVPGFATVTEEQALRFLGTARVERYTPGEAVTDRWALARTFYIVVGGRLSVVVDGREVNVLEPGDHFGEIAAIDWGRDFSYGRTATVIAEASTTVLAFPAGALRELMTDAPEVDRSMRRVAQARLAAR
jgi:signal-transduction protein with cAMP-binding, CBS, and nucleotidyltransferase domain